MATYGIYRLILEIVGRDSTGNIFQRITSGMGSIMRYATAIIGSEIFFRISEGIASMVSNTIEAIGLFQTMELTLASLSARELVRLSEGTKTVEEVWGDATVKAKGLMDELSRFAILSPYTVEATQTTYKMAMAFGYTNAEAMKYTKALMTYSAGIGANNSMLERMAYNLAQVRLQGKVTALDIRQLAQAGFDLVDVLRFTGKELGINIKDHLDFNEAIKSGQITWEQFIDSFAKYAEVNFSGAAERMARTLEGLKSTFHDVFVLTMPKLLGPAAMRVTDSLNLILNRFIAFRESGKLEEMAKVIEQRVDGIMNTFDKLATWFQTKEPLNPRRFLNLMTIFFDLKTASKYTKWFTFVYTNAMRGAALIGKAFEFLKGLVMSVFTSLTGWLDQNSDKIFAGVEKAWVTLNNWWTTKGLPVVQVIYTKVSSIFSNIVSFVRQYGPQIAAAFGSVFATIGTSLGKVDVAAIIGSVLGVFESFSAWLLANGPQITAIITNLADQFNKYLGPAIEWVGGVLAKHGASIAVFAGIFFTAMTTIVPVVMPVISVISKLGTIFGLVSHLISLGVPIFSVIGTVIGAIAGPILIIIGVLALLATAWTMNWGGIQEKAAAVWDWLKGAWATVMAAFQTALPFLQELWTRLATAFSQSVQNFMSVFDFITQLIRLIAAPFVAAIRFLGATFLWLMGFVIDPLKSVLKDLADWFGPRLKKPIDDLKRWAGELGTAIYEKLYKNFDSLVAVAISVRDWIDRVTGKIKELADKLMNLKLPEFLESHSPSPFEQSLMHVNSLMDTMASQKIPYLQAQLNQMRSPMGAGAGTGGVSVAVSVGNISSEADIQRLAYEIGREVNRKRRS